MNQSHHQKKCLYYFPPQQIHEIIKEGIEIPEEKNDLRKQQLRELALLNGTLRDNDAGLQ